MPTLKFIYQDNIHKLSEIPPSFSSLIEFLKSSLKSHLPQSYVLQYQDLEGDMVMLTNEEDFKAMVLTELPKDSTKSLKIFVVAKEVSSHNDKSSIRHDLDGTQQGKLDVTKNTTMITGNTSLLNDSVSYSRVQDSHENTIQESFEKGASQRRDDSSSSEEEKDERSRDDAESLGSTRKHESMEYSKDGIKDQRRHMKRDMKIQRQMHKAQVLKETIADVLYDSLPNMARVIRSYVEDPTINLEETVQNIRPKSKLAENMESQADMSMKFQRPVIMLKSMMECFRGLPDEKRKGINEMLGGIPEKILERRHHKERERDDMVGFEKKHHHHHHHLHPPPYYGHKEHYRKEGKDESGGRWKEKNPYKKHEKRDKGEYDDGGNPGKWRNDRGGKDEGYGRWDKKDKGEYKPKEDVYRGKEYSVELIKEVGSIPPKMTLGDDSMYKTILIKNNGTTEWPRSALLVPKGEIIGQTVRLSNVQPGQEFAPVLVLKNPGKVGEYSMTWKLAYKDGEGKTVYVGSDIKIRLTVHASA